MKRRDVIKGGVAAALATGAGTVAAPAIAANRIEITMVSTWPLAPIRYCVMSSTGHRL